MGAVGMPRRRPDQVITHRIEFNQKERELLSQLAATYTLEKSAESIDDLLSFENLYIGATIYEMVTGEEILFGTPNDLGELLGAFKDYMNRRKVLYPDDPPGAGLAMFVKDALVEALGLNQDPFPQFGHGV